MTQQVQEYQNLHCYNWLKPKLIRKKIKIWYEDKISLKFICTENLIDVKEIAAFIIPTSSGAAVLQKGLFQVEVLFKHAYM